MKNLDTGTLSHTQARHFRDQGYYRLPGVYSADETAEMREFVATLVRTIASNASIAEDIAESVVKIKGEIKVVEQELQKTQSKDDDFLKFVEFSLDYVDDLNAKWWDLTPGRRERCKQLSFPGGIL